jgi:hypothetical protein
MAVPPNTLFDGSWQPAESGTFAKVKEQIEAEQKARGDLWAKDAANAKRGAEDSPIVPETKEVVPTKIDVVTGKGVPGGFDASSIKPPAIAMAKIGSTLASIGAMAASIVGILAAVKSGAIPSIPGVSLPGLSTVTAKLDGLKAKAMDKLKAAAKAPDFTKKYKLPSPPSLPSMPDFKSMGIPSLPSMPSLPSLPNISLPSLPNVSIPSIPSVPKVPSIRGF